MVVLNKIYTRTGDGGETSIGDGSRVPKTNIRIVAGGSVDETNTLVGLAAAHVACEEVRNLLQEIQQRLFDLGADVTSPWTADMAEDHCPRIAPTHVEWVESHIDVFNSQLAPLKSFVLPGGSPAAAYLHAARSVCRRAEIDLLRLQEEVTINPKGVVFLNRLSDLLFVLARDANDGGKSDVLWTPGTQSGAGESPED